MNRQKLQEKAEEPVARKKIKGGNTVSRIYVKYLNAFGIFTKDMLISVMPFILFIAGLCLVYIANSYYAEKTVREIDRTSKELKTLRTEYITGASELMMISKGSEVAKAVGPMGLKEPVEAPRKIIVNKSASENKD